jgi:hypothetical protein
MTSAASKKRVGLEEISQKTRVAAQAVNDLISSMVLAVEEKVHCNTRSITLRGNQST